MEFDMLFFICIAIFLFTCAITARVFLGKQKYSKNIKLFMVALLAVVFIIFLLFSVFYISNTLDRPTIIVKHDALPDYYFDSPKESISPAPSSEPATSDTHTPAASSAPQDSANADTPSSDSPSDSSEIPADIDPNQIVYFTPNGTVYHLRKDCSSLSRSKEILEGTVEDAYLEGKEKPCKQCGPDS